MRIAFVTPYDALDVRKWSGLALAMAETFKAVGFQVEFIGPLRESHWLPFKLKQEAYRLIGGVTFIRDRHPAVLAGYARQVEAALSRLPVDLVFSPGTVPIAHLETKLPVVFWTGATFAGMVGAYPQFSNLCAETYRDGHRMEQQALSRCRLAIYASEWAAESAREHYQVPPGKLAVVPYGANLVSGYSEREVRALLDSKPFDTCRLLFVGVDWERKGGDLAVQTAELLNRRGFPTRLDVVGCDPPGELPACVHLHGYLSRRMEAGQARLHRLFSQAHFLVQPSRAENYGVVFAEASSFGLPSLATRVGGIPGAVREGVNGRLFDLEQGAESYADAILQELASRKSYRDLALSSYREYRRRLNWATSGKRVRALIERACR